MKQMHREAHILKKMERCVHFTGIQHDICKAGVCYSDVKDTTVRPYEFPCLGKGTVTCDKRLTPTRERAEAEEAEFEAAFARVKTCRRAITERHGKTRGVADEMLCPIGCGGTLRYSISGYNGHIHGRCSTTDCANWME